ncbi:MAG: UDPGP type 1 family protein [Phycisphaerales bacterium]|nr:UDPGP type 1 family protein [Phycisphaerales bacterium]
MNLAEIRARLDRTGQSHLLQFFDRLEGDRQRVLLEQIASLSLEELPLLVETYVKKRPVFTLPKDLAPARYYPVDPACPARPWDRARYRAVGEDLLRRGEVAAFVVAGGQGSRLGFEGPKGCFPAGAVTGKPLFQIFAEGLLATQRRYGRAIPWYIMTSPLNHDATVAFFDKHRHFGLGPKDVMFFPQGVMPSFDMATGKVLLAAPDEVATNPDGHGGSLRALKVSGALADMRHRGVRHLSYFQVDNPLVRVLDPVFIGLHAAAPDSSGEMSSKMIPRTSPEEKVGVFCTVNGKTEVIEYSDLPPDLSAQRLEDGSLRFIAGSIAIHMIGVDFIDKVNSDPAFSLPYHRADKKVPHIDLATGQPVNPEKPNGVKLERFVFDALAFCRASIVLETDRVEEFAPIKNATGVDSVESCSQLQTQRAARWLEYSGVKTPRLPDGKPDAVIEISPLTALEPADLASRADTIRIPAGARISL